jgi:hypothetical protein
MNINYEFTPFLLIYQVAIIGNLGILVEIIKLNTLVAIICEGYTKIPE